MSIRITTVVENTVRTAGLLGEHGLAFWIETDKENILFDTGQGHALKNNVDRLGIALGSVDALALSHGHYDHTGGLDVIFESGARPRVYVHPQALGSKYARNDPPPHRNVGIQPAGEQILRASQDIVWTEEPVEIANGVYLTGEIPRQTDYEDTGGAFYLDSSCTEVDPLVDDQALYLETGEGLVVILGCAHAGVVNTLDYISSISGHKRIHAVIGGMHLLRAGERRLRETAGALERYDVQVIAPAHCTGIKATAYFWRRFPDHCLECAGGSRFCFRRPAPIDGGTT